MSKEVEISFHGMGGLLAAASCIIMPNRSLYDAGGGHAGHGHDAGGQGPGDVSHRARLVVPTELVLDREHASWPPQEVVVYGEEELGIWNLDGLDVQIDTGEPKTPTKTITKGGPPSGDNGMVQRFDMLSLRELHPEAVTRPDWEQIPGCTKVRLNGGMIAGGGKGRFENAGSFSGKDVASYMSWMSTVNKLAITCGDKVIRISLDTPKKVSLSITNGASVPGDHFPIMYSLIKGLATPAISPREPTGHWVYPAETCKPPVELPSA